MPDPSGARQFNDEEVALIIKRAAELQQTEQSEQEPGHTLSLSEIEQIAREAGIDPRLIRRAAQGIDHHTESVRPNPWLGAPTRIVLERVVDGEVGPDDYEALVNEMRRTFGDNGVPSVLGRTLAWTAAPSGGRANSRRRSVDISIISRAGVTTIRVEEELRNVAAPLFAGLLAGGAGGTSGITVGAVMATVGSGALAGVAWVVVAGGFYALARNIFGRIAKKRETQLRELSSRLEGQVREAVAAGSTGRIAAGRRKEGLLNPGEAPGADSG